MNFPLRTAFDVSYRVWDIVHSFSFVSRNFLISSLISLLIHSLFDSLIGYYSVSMSLNVFEFFPWSLFLVSGPCGPRKYLIWFQFSWIYWCLFLPYHVHLKIMCILFLWDESFCIYQLSPFVLVCHSVPCYLCWFFVCKISSLLTLGCYTVHYHLAVLWELLFRWRKEKRKEKNEDSISSLWDNIKRFNIHIIGVPEGEEKEQEIGSLFEKNNERKLP